MPEKTSENLSLINFIERNHDGIIIVDRAGLVLFANLAATKIFNRSRQQLCGKQFEFPLPGDKTIEINIPGKSKEFGVARMQQMPIEWLGKRAVVLLVHDISDLKKTEMLKSAIDERRRIDRIKNEFISNVSHELRTPLTSVREGISQILEGFLGKTTVGQKKFLSMCLEDIDRLSRIIDGLLDISRIESGKIILKKETLDIVDLAKSAVSSLSVKIKNKRLELIEDYPKEKTEIYVDRDRIIEVFVNLLGNAIKFTDKGHIGISIKNKPKMVECCIEDTGRGIAKKDLSRVFVRFQQFGRVFGPGEKGTGLGLSIVKSIIELHKGQIRVESKLNKGTRFIFTLFKYTSKELFRQYIVDSLREAVHNDEPLSIFLFYIDDLALVRKEFESQKITSLMNKFYEIVGGHLRRQADLAVKDDSAILLVLPVTKNEYIESIQLRLKQALEEYLTKEGLDKKIKIGCRTAGFPRDGSSADVLFDKIQEVLN
ncbi:MAG: PAS domain-containing sensor histidine kinase [Candidatus Omnitrophica bacterium]|jgi:signal transduction histidine kinase|nr:PAS domain-containing sensor histidine kinase [Candidatus Omnitrophota bacterium]